jgi:DNA-binding CsgD family transcriptional regulator/tetratricopeptide (TPR) repeat protein
VELLGRRRERDVLDRLVQAVRDGQSRALIIGGEPGMGKTALLDHVADHATGCHVVRAAGVQSEMELAFAGLHQLCAPMLDRLDRLPPPQADALRIAFGVAPGSPPDRFVVGLAVLNLLSDVAEERPLICLIDDEQWLDRASAQVLAFVARRLGAESVGLIFGTRIPSSESEALPVLMVEGLNRHDGRELLDATLVSPLDERIRDQAVAETRGNPLALLELAHGISLAKGAAGYGFPDAVPLTATIEASFERQVHALPVDARRLIQLAAAEPLGDPVLLWNAAERLGIAPDGATPAAESRLLEFGRRVRFRHPLVRSAAYRSTSFQERHSIHRALAEVTDPEVDPDRRAWHLALATSAPDEDVAAELERSADRAQARGGFAAAAAFLDRAAELTLDAMSLADRTLAAAHANLQAGAPDEALRLLTAAQAGPLDELQGARVDLLQAEIAALSRGSDGPPLLLRAAKRLEALDPELARETYREAFAATLFVGRLATGAGVVEAAEATRAAPPPRRRRRAADLLLDGLTLAVTEDLPSAAPILKQALSAFRGESLSSAEAIRWLYLACRAANYMWDDEAWEVLSDRLVRQARDSGALTALPAILTSRIGGHLVAGDFAAAATLIEEIDAIADATGADRLPYGALALAAWEGRESDATELIESALNRAVPRGEGFAVAVTAWARAVLYNGLGRYEDGLAAAQVASEYPGDLDITGWGLIELVEAATRSGKAGLAARALERLGVLTRASGTDWALGTEACARALVTNGEDAEHLYREAIERLGRSRAAVPLARGYLLYGEWLRRERRRVDAREQLRVAHGMFALMGAEAFAERAQRELMATGVSVGRRTVERSRALTAQEARIAHLAKEGLSNPEIGTRLFISARTVKYHLSKVYTKLSITSREQLDRALPAETAAGST